MIELVDCIVFEAVEVLRSPTPQGPMGAPAVVATRAARNSRPTVLLYAHHDVQPPGADELWESEPFKTEVRNGRMYGRGAADDKAGVIAHVYAIKALRELTQNDFDLGLVVFIEGEEGLVLLPLLISSLNTKPICSRM